MKEMFYRDHLIAAHAVPVGASAGVRYGYQGEILPAGERAATAQDPPTSFASDVETAFDNAATAIEACLLEGRRLIDARLDGADTPAASSDPTRAPGSGNSNQRSMQ
ncbi:hypothetical protein [Cupriavidus gilardii]|uniref:hypothetical protein n=1 Tax=Cupriavidus gilardii TaxID=82541 RepID=UPI00157184A2|nr:hypothetical protein [Cupriavidus gilardii]NSX03069.1 hypothetical protein [Cupriavidus gilardii]